MKKATIKDVAQAAGVSISTVSRVLNGAYPVKIATQHRVWQAVKRLNFSRNTMAQNLRTHKSKLVALVVADINNPYYAQLAKQVDECLFENGYNLLVCNTDESAEKEDRILAMLADRGVDAVAISSAGSSPLRIRQLIDLGMHVVLLDRDIGVADVPFIGSDNFAEAQQLTEYLIQAGHRRIGFVAGTPGAATAEDRLRGYRAALLAHGLTYDPHSVLQGQYQRAQAEHVMTRFLRASAGRPAAVTAWVSANNLMTEGIIAAAQRLGLAIPADLSLVSFGEIDAQAIIAPKVTCIRQRVDQLADRVTQQLLAAVTGKPAGRSTRFIIQDDLVPGYSVRRQVHA